MHADYRKPKTTHLELLAFWVAFGFVTPSLAPTGSIRRIASED